MKLKRKTITHSLYMYYVQVIGDLKTKDKLIFGNLKIKS